MKKQNKTKQNQKNAPLQDSVRGYMREIFIAMFLQIQSDNSCVITRLSQKVYYEGGFYSHVFANPVRYIDVHRRSQDSAPLAVNERNRPVGELLKS